jgi:hypothetical protein
MDDPSSGGALGEDSSTSQAENGKKEPTLADAVDALLKGKKVESTSEGSEELSSENELNPGEEEKEKVDDTQKEEGVEDEETVEEEVQTEEPTEDEQQTEEEKGTEGKEKGKIVEGKPVPYERFAEVNSNLKNVKQELESFKPMVENYRQIDNFCRQYQITPEQFKNVMEVQALLNTNPEAALAKLTPIVDQLKTFSGDVLPTDLQKAVDDGDLSLKYAKEVARSRAVSTFGTKKLEHDKRNFEATQQQIVQKQLSDSTSAWEKSKRDSDPDYKPKAKATDPDGKWEAVKRQFLGMLHEVDEKGQFANPVTNPQQMTELLEESYQFVNKFIGQFRSKKPIKKPLHSDSSSSANGHNSTSLKGKRIEDQPTMGAAIQVALAQRR